MESDIVVYMVIAIFLGGMVVGALLAGCAFVIGWLVGYRERQV